MSHGGSCGWGGVLGVSYLCYLLALLAYRMDVFTPMPLTADGYPFLITSTTTATHPPSYTISDRHSDKCEVLHEMQAVASTATDSPVTFKSVLVPDTGFEDLSWIDDRTAVSCAGNLWGTFEGLLDPDAVATSTCVLIRRQPSAPSGIELLQLQIEGFPTGIAMRAHGLYVSPPSTTDALPRLYMINHAYNKGGERVDYFDIDESRLALTYVGSLAGNKVLQELAMGGLNDLIVFSERDLYITVAFAPVDAAQTSRPLYRFLRSATAYGELLFDAPATRLMHCRDISNSTDAADWRCRVAANDLGMANGITFDHRWRERQGVDRPLLFVSDLTAHSLVVFAVEPASGILTRLRSQWLLNAVDNIEFDRSTVLDRAGEPHRYRFTVGGIVNMIDAAKTLHKRDALSRGCVSTIELVIREVPRAGRQKPSAAVELLVEQQMAAHNGVLMGGTSSGVLMQVDGGGQDAQGTTRRSVALMSSYANHGIMVCRLN